MGYFGKELSKIAQSGHTESNLTRKKQLDRERWQAKKLARVKTGISGAGWPAGSIITSQLEQV